MNKGTEAMGYLQFIIDYYEKLPASIAFIHGGRCAVGDSWVVVSAALPWACREPGAVLCKDTISCLLTPQAY